MNVKREAGEGVLRARLALSLHLACLACLACLTCAALLFCIECAPPAYAANGDYAVDELSTDLVVEPDGATRIIERQVVTFENVNEGMVWYLHVPEGDESVRITQVRVAPVDDGGTLLSEWTRLQMVDSNPQRQGRNPGDLAVPALRTQSVQPWYSYSIGDGMLRCYFPLMGADAIASGAATGDDAASGVNADQNDSTDPDAPADSSADMAADPNADPDANQAADPNAGSGADRNADASISATTNSAQSSESHYRTYVIETEYTIRNRVAVYRDVAELYWRYAHDSIPSDSRDVNLQIHLPVPGYADPTQVASSIHAWGHGPNEGTFTVGDDGVVTYHIDRIAQGSYAEAHVIFPQDWMTSTFSGDANSFLNARGPAAIAEEANWVDVSQREAAWDNNVRVLFGVLAGVIVAIGGVLAIWWGRSPRSRRALQRVAATLGIVALGEHLFFKEPITTFILVGLAAAVFLVALAMPAENQSEAEPSSD